MELLRRITTLALLAGLLCASLPAFSAITYVGSSQNPNDNGSLDDTVARSITPPASLQTGDFVYLLAAVRSTAAVLSIASSGGHSWTAETQRAIAGSGQVRVFHTRYSGAWSGDVAVETSNKAGNPITLVMLAFRPTSNTNTWSINVAQQHTPFGAPSSPFDVTASGQTTSEPSTVTLTVFGTVDDTSWGLQTAGWSNPSGTTQFRNLAGNDLSVSVAYKIQTSSGATGNVTNRQTAQGPDAGHWMIETFAESAVGKKWHTGHYMRADNGSSLNTRLGYCDSIENESAIQGLHVVYFWADLESTQGTYTFADNVGELLDRCTLRGKRLMLEIWTRAYGSGPGGIVPSYVQNMGGTNAQMYDTGNGYAVKVWNASVMDRLIALYQALAAQYDTHPNFEAVITAETAVGSGASGAGYTASAFLTQYQRLLSDASAAWPNTLLRLNANFVTGGSNANMQTLINACVTNRCGVGGPDILTASGTPTQAQNILNGTVLGHDYRGEIPIMFNAEQASVSNYDPSTIYDNAIDTTKTTHLSWLRYTWGSDPDRDWDTGILPFLQSNPTLISACPSELVCETE